MNERKKHVIIKAHQLFVEKGFQATSIQDILDDSGISKGTFYNYFPSKNELLMAIFRYLNERINHERNELLMGRDPSDIEIFVQQLELQMFFNQRNKMISLFEEVFESNDPTLKQFLKRSQLLHLRWIYKRFLDIFGLNKQPYLLDCAIIFMGILHHNIHFQFMANEASGNIKKVIRYTVDRIVRIVEEVESAGAQLLDPTILEKWIPECKTSNQGFEQRLHESVLILKKLNENSIKNIELLNFILEEVLNSKKPRTFLIESALYSLKENPDAVWQTEVKKLEQITQEICNTYV